MAYLITLRPRNLLLFLDECPSNDLPGVAIATAGIRLSEPLETLHAWPDGADAPLNCVGRNPDDGTDYAIFRTERKLREAGFEFVPGTWGHYRSFRDLPDDLKSDLRTLAASQI